MKSKEDLRQLLLSIDHRGYPAYKETRGQWSYGNYILSIDHVQGDPFASPSNVSVIVPGRVALFPEEYRKEEHRRIALQDHLLRLFGRELAEKERRYAGSGKSGLVTTSRPGQEILERTACRVDPATGNVTVRFQVGFPANGRTINARELIRILDDFLPGAVSSSLVCSRISRQRLTAVMDLADDQKYIREALVLQGLCAFVADGSILPRMSGISSLPMKDAIPFRSPDTLAVTLDLPHRGALRGMGIRRGITLIVGGGYHGKSTLLQALERGVYNHIAGDGREYVITDDSAMKIRSEDGRSIVSTDISLFIRDLPNRKDTVHFSTEDASGSTSQAANVIEAMEAGTGLLLIDEDTCATNFMVRDELMARVVSRDKEPITPFISRIRDMYEQAGISTILVAGSSGAFFHVADTVIQMDRYVPLEITEAARAAMREDAAASGTSCEPASGQASPQPSGQASPQPSGQAGAEHAGSPAESAGLPGGSETDPARGTCDASRTGSVYRAPGFLVPAFRRVPEKNSALAKEGRIKLKVLSEDGFLLMKDEVDVRGLEQLVDREQTAALAYILKYMQLHVIDGRMSLRQSADQIMALLHGKGLEALFDGGTIGNGLAQVRRAEICGMLNRYRRLRIR